MKKLFIFFVALLLSGYGFAQTKTFKEIKTLEKQIPFKTGERLFIQGERTFMTIKSWDKNFIKAKVEVISRFTNQDVARADLEKINVLFDKKGKTHTYSNAIQLASPVEKPRSNLKVELILFVPSSATFEIVNHFGKIVIEGDFKNLKISSEFSNINISNFDGNAEISTKYGDTDIQESKGDFKVKADRSNLALNEVYGILAANIKYGELEVFYSEQASNYSIDAKYSPVKLHIPLGLKSDLNLECVQCDIVSNNDKKVSNKRKKEDVVAAKVNPQGVSSGGTIRSEVEDIILVFEANK